MLAGSKLVTQAIGMPRRPDQTTLSTHIDRDLAARFQAWARGTEGGTSAALRRIISEAVDGKPAAAPAGAGQGQQVGVRFKPSERQMLSEAAHSRATTPAAWLRSLALVHLARTPQWNSSELDELRDVFRELRRIGNNVNQIARALNVAAHNGEYPLYQREEARAAAERVRFEMRRVVSMMTGNFDYWGLPDADCPTAAVGAEVRDEELSRLERRALKSRARYRPSNAL